MHAHIHTQTHTTQMHPGIHTIHIYIDTCTWTNAQAQTHTQMHTHAYTHAPTHKQVNKDNDFFKIKYA